MKKLTMALCSAVLLLSGCATTMSTFTDRDADADFSSYQTFSWIDEHPLTVKDQIPVVANPLMESRIRNAIQQELTLRGFEFVPVAGDADLVVSFTVSARQQINTESQPVTYRGSWRWGGTYVGDSVDIQTVTEGTLAIDFFDTQTRAPVWHGRAERSLNKKERERSNELIKETVTAILADFPSPASADKS